MHNPFLSDSSGELNDSSQPGPSVSVWKSGTEERGTLYID